MSAALRLASVLTFAAVIAAESPLSMVGEGLMSSPHGSKGVRYAGPIVYTNEKPPIIYFPPPPKNAKPGFGGYGIFGKNKSPKSIKYVPMPHHDLPVLIYTSDKTPPIHMIQPPSNDGPIHQATQHAPIRDFGPRLRPGLEAPSSFVPTGSLSSIYSGIPEYTQGRIMTTTYEIPSTSYGNPVNPFGSPVGSSDSFSSSSIQNDNTAPPPHQQQQQQNSGPGPQPAIGYHLPATVQVNNQKPVYVSQPGGPPRKNLPHIMYSGHPPIHIFNEPDMFVQAPHQVPYKTYEDLPPKASFGPPKSSFGPPSVNSFHSSIPPYRRPFPAFGPPQYRPSPMSYFPPRENLVTSASINNPSSFMSSFDSHGPPSPSSQHIEHGAHVSQPYGGSSYSSRPLANSFAPQHNSYSIGPFSIEYGPPSEPLMSFSEPSGSLSSLYGAISGNGAQQQQKQQQQKDSDGWMPGPPPPSSSNSGEPLKEESWNPQQQSNIGPMPGPNSMHSSVFLPPSSSSSSSGYSGPFGGSKLANLFSSFKFKRSKPKYAIAPKSMHKPPIIIYYGKKPPMHVYQQPEEEFVVQDMSASSSDLSSDAPSNVEIDISNINNDDNGNFNSDENNAPAISTADTVDLTYEASSKSEVRVEPESKPAIIAAKPVDIFPSSELQPSIYMARNSLNTIFVSDLSGSGARAIKTYIVRNSEDSNQQSGPAKLDLSPAAVITPNVEQKREAVSSKSSNSDDNGSIPIAENRISGSSEISSASSSLSENPEDNGNNAVSPAILVAAVSSQSEPEQQNEQPAEQQEQAVKLSPSSFQTNLSQAEKEAKEASSSS
ncbi:hypothetical protein Ocin01_00276 [Orchesella cincta]|uniref:Uncharacterized protein n=1 Tax=Orchesella cincta TaxID=48709 RepID=A0A1D2NMC8_ORCCI|nr:hypothetical protein Ocin01_00276 [Orchesella cincta]